MQIAMEFAENAMKQEETWSTIYKIFKYY